MPPADAVRLTSVANSGVADVKVNNAFHCGDLDVTGNRRRNRPVRGETECES